MARSRGTVTQRLSSISHEPWGGVHSNLKLLRFQDTSSYPTRRKYPSGGINQVRPESKGTWGGAQARRWKTRRQPQQGQIDKWLASHRRPVGVAVGTDGA